MSSTTKHKITEAVIRAYKVAQMIHHVCIATLKEIRTKVNQEDLDKAVRKTLKVQADRSATRMSNDGNQGPPKRQRAYGK